MSSMPCDDHFFDRLPDEILLHVFRFLPPIQIQQIRRVDKRFERIITRNRKKLPLIEAKARMHFGINSVTVEAMTLKERKFSDMQCYARGKVVGRFIKPAELFSHLEAKCRRIMKVSSTGHGLCDVVLVYFSILASQFHIHLQQLSMKELQSQSDLINYCIRKSGLKLASVHLELNISNKSEIKKLFESFFQAGCRKFIIDDFVSGSDLNEDFLYTLCPHNVYLHRKYVRVTYKHTIIDTILKWRNGSLSIGIIRYNQCDVSTEDIAAHLGIQLEGEGFFVDRPLDKKVLRFENFPVHSKRTDERLIFVCERREELSQQLRESIKKKVLKN